jgi:hypothetical protein
MIDDGEILGLQRIVWRDVEFKIGLRYSHTGMELSLQTRERHGALLQWEKLLLDRKEELGF